MKKFKKLASIVIAASMITSSLAFTVTANAATNTGEQHVAEVADNSSQASARGSVILHAFNWSYKTIQENLPEIAAAGYTAVQTSPVQQPKDFYTSNDIAGQWWKLYQPVSMSIAKDTWLGTKEDLTSMCAEADKYGIKIICDIVSNHMGNETESDPNSLSSQVQTYDPKFAENKSTYFHSETFSASDGSIQGVVRGHVSSCPDLNTANKDVQNAVVGLLKECIDCGVDGFRFDAAKHIETPDDGDYASDYWPTITGEAGSYYKEKTGGELYIYGEILNTCGSGRNYKSYTPYIGVTDNNTGNAILSAVKGGNASSAAKSGYTSGLTASDAVLWAESHDTFIGSAGNTSTVSDENIVKTWAIVASRKDATALYFARPDGSTFMGDAAGNKTYKSTAVSEINKFHNLFVGQDEKLGASDGVAYVARGTNGIVLSNCKGTEKDVSISDTGMADGTYTDTITGNKFTVASGVLTGSIGSTGVAVVYDGTTTPRNTCSVESGSFKGETLVVKLGLENATSGTYALDNSTPVTYTGDIAIRIGSDYNYGDTINLTLTATDGTNNTTVTYKYVKTEAASSGVYVFYDPSLRKNWKAPFNVYIYDEKSTSGKTYCNADWPGQQMQLDEASGLWYIEVSATKCVSGGKEADFDLAHSSNARVIINDSATSGSSSHQYPAQNEEGLALDGKSHIFANPKASSWEPTDLVPSSGAAQDATDVTRDGSVVPGTTETTEQIATTKPSDDYIDVLLGDADSSNNVDVKDVTHIQKHIAAYFTLTGVPALAADVDGNRKINVDDVTLVQKYLAKYTLSYKIGQTVKFLQNGTPTPTTADPKPTTADPKPTVSGDAKRFYVGNYVTWLDKDGCKLWAYNNDTGAFMESTGYESNDGGICGYFYFDLPSDWVNLSIYRTPFDTTKETFDLNSPWNEETHTGIIINKWERLGDKGTNNAFKATADGQGFYETFDPDAKKSGETSRTIYFDNSKTKWSSVYIYGWSFGLSEEFVQMESVGNDIYSYTFKDTLPMDGVNGFLFVESTTWGDASRQTNDLATQEGKNLFVPAPTGLTGIKVSGSWDVYNP